MGTLTMKTVKRVLLVLPTNHYLNDTAINICSQFHYIHRFIEFGSFDRVIGGNNFKLDDYDLILNFLCPHIYKGHILNHPNIVNFHPATPAYRGIGGASRALAQGAIEFGATAHRIIKEIDAGEILAVNRFTIGSLYKDNCKALFGAAEFHCLYLLEHIISYFDKHGELPPKAANEKWSEFYMSRKQFNEWITVHGHDVDFVCVFDFHEVDVKVKAIHHPDKPGPFITIGKHTFAYVKD